MKIIILHGDDIERSYLRLKKFIDVAKTRGWEITNIDDADIGVKEVLSANSLFKSEQFFILKDIKKLGKKEIYWISKNLDNLSGTLIIYNDGLINPATLKLFPKETKIEEYKLHVLLWNFLDNLVPGRGDYSIKTLHKILEKKPIEFIFSLIAKQYKDLYWIKTDTGSTGFPFWKINKLKTQSSKYTLEKLRQIIKVLSDIDIKVKTSKTDLISELDIFILKQLK